MMAKKKKSTSAPDMLQDDVRLIEDVMIKENLFRIFEKAKATKNMITPDAAIKELGIRISELLAKVYKAPNWQSAVQNLDFPLYPPSALREAHHMAVDLFYDLYYGTSTKGAPTVPYFYLIYIVLL